MPDAVRHAPWRTSRDLAGSLLELEGTVQDAHGEFHTDFWSRNMREAMATCDFMTMPTTHTFAVRGAHFDGAGLAARSVRYRARLSSPAPAADVAALLEHTDAVAEVHNTLRASTEVVRLGWEDDDGSGPTPPRG